MPKLPEWPPRIPDPPAGDHFSSSMLKPDFIVCSSKCWRRKLEWGRSHQYGIGHITPDTNAIGRPSECGVG